MSSSIAATRATVVALHCSGGAATQWRALQATLAARFEVHAPEHYGSESRGLWPGEHAFSLSDEAKLAVEIIDGCRGPVHLVGHSYGGAVALQAALERPDRVASVGVYEPCVFRMLSDMGEAGRSALADLRGVAAHMIAAVADGTYARAAQSRLIADARKLGMPLATLQVIAGAGHMGPLTHPEIVTGAIARHIARCEAARRERPLGAAQASDGGVLARAEPIGVS